MEDEVDLVEDEDAAAKEAEDLPYEGKRWRAEEEDEDEDEGEDADAAA